MNHVSQCKLKGFLCGSCSPEYVASQSVCQYFGIQRICSIILVVLLLSNFRWSLSKLYLGVLLSQNQMSTISNILYQIFVRNTESYRFSPIFKWSFTLVEGLRIFTIIFSPRVNTPPKWLSSLCIYTVSDFLTGFMFALEKRGEVLYKLLFHYVTVHINCFIHHQEFSILIDIINICTSSWINDRNIDWIKGNNIGKRVPFRDDPVHNASFSCQLQWKVSQDGHCSGSWAWWS